jgi:hypothetical protein
MAIREKEEREMAAAQEKEEREQRQEENEKRRENHNKQDKEKCTVKHEKYAENKSVSHLDIESKENCRIVKVEFKVVSKDYSQILKYIILKFLN